MKKSVHLKQPEENEEAGLLQPEGSLQSESAPLLGNRKKEKKNKTLSSSSSSTSGGGGAGLSNTSLTSNTSSSRGSRRSSVTSSNATTPKSAGMGQKPLQPKTYFAKWVPAWSSPFYMWMSPILKIAREERLKELEFTLDDEQEAEVMAAKLEHTFEHYYEHYLDLVQKNPDQYPKEPVSGLEEISKNPEECKKANDLKRPVPKGLVRWALFWTYFRIHGGTIAIAWIPYLIKSACTLAIPFLLKWFLKFLELPLPGAATPSSPKNHTTPPLHLLPSPLSDSTSFDDSMSSSGSGGGTSGGSDDGPLTPFGGDGSIQTGIVLVSLLIAAHLIKLLAFHFHFALTLDEGIEIKTSFAAFITRRITQLPLRSKWIRDGSAHILSLVKDDVGEIAEAAGWFQYSWSVPAEFVATSYLAYWLVGWPGLVSMAYIFVSECLQIKISQLRNDLDDDVAEVVDKRVSLVQNFLNGITTVHLLKKAKFNPGPLLALRGIKSNLQYKDTLDLRLGDYHRTLIKEGEFA